MIQIITIGISAFLLFLLQPMISKIILPDFGGGASVWLTSIIFYQLLLLGGYSFSNLSARRLKPKYQAAVFTAIILVSLLFIPVHVHLGEINISPVLHIFILLFGSIGMPYFLLSTTSPTVQSWFAAENKKKNPYILYGVSNAGSLVGLLSYPLFIEPNMTTNQQTAFLSWGFVAYTLFLFLCLVIYLKKNSSKQIITREEKQEQSPPGNVDDAAPHNEETSKPAFPWSQRLSWMGLSLLPSAALMVFTNYIAIDVINFPLLWVIPLSIYLISFVLCFLVPMVSKPGIIRSMIMILPVLGMTFALRWRFEIGLGWKLAASCTCLFAICTYFHGNLERAKPASQHLTSFYLYLSLGGCLGSTLAGIVAPLIFKSTVEIYLVLIASFYLILLPFFQYKRKIIRLSFKVAAILLVVVSFLSEEVFFPGFITKKARTFYCSYMVMEIPRIPGRKIPVRAFRHGTTVHGGQARDRKNRLMPLFYYHRQTGISMAFNRLSSKIKSVGVVGLGTGMVALYAQPGQSFDFYEIDQKVVDIAEQDFDNLRSSAGKIRHLVGDARLKMRSIPDNYYDFLLLDAFNSGSIPIHLITLDALKEYLRVLRPNGIIMFNITNKYLDLLPVLNDQAQRLGLSIVHQFSPQDVSYYKYTTHWALLTKNQEWLNIVTRGRHDWEPPGEERILWTDDFNNLWSVIKW